MNTKRTVTNIVKKCEDDQSSDLISVATYNILADCHIHHWRDTLYAHISDEDLFKRSGERSNRHLLLLKELDFLDADILLLQEVGTEYTSLLAANLERRGYTFSFFQKTEDIEEGCSICYKNSKFIVEDSEDILLADEIRRYCEEDGVDLNIMNDLRRDTVGMIRVLKHCAEDKRLIAANTHIVYNSMSSPDLQALQVCIMCNRISDLRNRLAETHGINPDEIPVLFGGDFNGSPEHMSIQLAKRKILKADEIEELKYLYYTPTLEVKKREVESTLLRNLRNRFHNPLHLLSAYAEVVGDEPLLTTSDGECIACFDYVFHTSNIEPRYVLTVDEEVADVYRKGGPTKQFASDHLPVKAGFLWK